MSVCKKLQWRGGEWHNTGERGLNENLWFRSYVTCMCEVKKEECPHQRTMKNIVSAECFDVAHQVRKK